MQYLHDPGISPSSANQCILDSVYQGNELDECMTQFYALVHAWAELCKGQPSKCGKQQDRVLS